MSVVDEGDSLLTILNKHPLTVWEQNDDPGDDVDSPLHLDHQHYNGFGSVCDHRSRYFNPIATPVWDFEHTFFNYYPIVKDKPKTSSGPIKLPYSY